MFVVWWCWVVCWDSFGVVWSGCFFVCWGWCVGFLCCVVVGWCWFWFVVGLGLFRSKRLVWELVLVVVVVVLLVCFGRWWSLDIGCGDRLKNCGWVLLVFLVELKIVVIYWGVGLFVCG